MTSKTRESLINNVIVGLQQTIEHERDLVKDLETQIKDCNVSRLASEEEAQVLMIENGKLRRAIKAIIDHGSASRVDTQAAFDREMGA